MDPDTPTLAKLPKDTVKGELAGTAMVNTFPEKVIKILPVILTFAKVMLALVTAIRKVLAAIPNLDCPVVFIWKLKLPEILMKSLSIRLLVMLSEAAMPLLKMPNDPETFRSTQRQPSKQTRWQ